MKELLVEIGVEELPAIPFLKELANIPKKWQDALDAHSLEADEASFYYTPRRLVFFHKAFSQKAKDSLEVAIGAPYHVAVKDGEYTNAAIGFAKKNGLSVDELKFKEIDGKNVLYNEKVVVGKPSEELFCSVISHFLSSLSFGKSMRWGSGEFEFIRPIRSIVCLFGGKNVDFSCYGVNSKAAFYPHRYYGYDLVPFGSASEYFELTQKMGIVLDQSRRKAMVLEQIKALESAEISVQIDEGLLDEVVAITELPNALLGSFEEEFLEIPSEVIITSMKENQRYFAVFNGDKLTNKFVVVSNMPKSDDETIVLGNEKVLRARLSDAAFFWRQDLENGLNPEGLKNVTYLKELGSMYDKQLREAKLAVALGELYKSRLEREVGSDAIELLRRAAGLAKADLISGMVYEFTELQGIMGGYYAKAANERAEVALAISEQYLPNGEDSSMPSTLFSSIIALSNKLDSLFSLFSLGRVPSGTKDPYALRRAANGVLKIILKEGIEFDISQTLAGLAKGYDGLDVKTLEEFILGRIYTFFDTNASVVKACIASGERDVVRLFDSISALSDVVQNDSFKENFSTFKRLANILKEAKIGQVDVSLFELEAERELNNAFNALDKSAPLRERLEALFALKPAIDKFFDDVMINVDDERVRANRIANIGQIYNAFLSIADIKEISI
ncbi:glycine--tRNA ligase subunit beta [Campylobacter sp. 19-13652]|uniref:glycine--tRNA ligase subunit beta n=1 Tax=Campylobacter sp. 19-13652 TaxID=2840180 RepID=UPI001C774ABA|nr:glycine--tRNA ligase subunit beta [Campylobacter sp. 19-13652]BCX79126.1 glycine--tRNA ligase beta subunit [Campylobacter sp. 19-13652]